MVLEQRELRGISSRTWHTSAEWLLGQESGSCQPERATPPVGAEQDKCRQTPRGSPDSKSVRLQGMLSTWAVLQTVLAPPQIRMLKPQPPVCPCQDGVGSAGQSLPGGD